MYFDFKQLTEIFYLVVRKKPLNEGDKEHAEGLARKFMSLNTSVYGVIDNMYNGRFISELDKSKSAYLKDNEVISVMVRGLYETFLAFNHLFVNPENKEDREIRMRLWFLSGLNSILKAQPFPTEHFNEKIREVKEKQEQIGVLFAESAYLDETSKKIVKTMIDKKNDDWFYHLEGAKLTKINKSYDGLAKRCGAKDNTFLNNYKLLSRQSHPTDSSAREHLTKWDSDSQVNHQMSHIINIATIIVAFMVYDYCSFFPSAKLIANTLPIDYKDKINYYLKEFRGDSYQI